ncbi:MAG: hypothetical protein LBG11_02375 [Bifidobacteriaceae bacterium]|jgi:hypothetical protein|nr:hypothetical protein [Bifidobacteriaceae bacterium]
MRFKRMAAVVAASAALVIGGGVAAVATSVTIAGTVSSGGTIKYFDNQRNSTNNVTFRLTEGPQMTVGLVNCSNISNVTGTSDKTFKTSDTAAKSYGASSKGKCFRIKASRTVPADTNGIWPGSGTTDFRGTLVY